VPELKNLYRLPVTNKPNNIFRAQVVVDGENREYILTLRYREVCRYWTMDVADLNGNDILVNVPLVTGVNLFQQLGYLGLGAVILIDRLNTGKSAAAADELGYGTIMLWGSEG
jgi:hypothetical protein